LHHAAGKGGMTQSFNPSPEEPAALRERRATAGYDSHGGGSTLLNVVPTDHFGSRPAPDTATSGTVSGESWERDPSQARQQPLLAQRMETRGAEASSGMQPRNTATGTLPLGSGSGSGAGSALPGSREGERSSGSGSGSAAGVVPSARLSAHVRPAVTQEQMRQQQGQGQGQ
jgi:hypothetical protein